MSDNIQYRDSQHSPDKMAWHGKTKISDTGVLERDIVYPYEIIEEPLMIRGRQHGDWFTPICTDDNETVGNGPCLRSSTYSMFTPKDTWDFLDEMMEGTDHRYISAGTTNNRSKFFISIELAGLDSINSAGRKFNFYLNAISSLDKSIPLVFVNSSICTVCENTLIANFFTKSWFKHTFKHTKNMGKAIEKFKRVLDEAFGVPALFKQAMDSFENIDVSETTARNIFTGALASDDAEKKIADSRHMSTRLDNTVERHVELFHDGLGNGGGTLVDVLSAFTQNKSRTDETDLKKVNRVISGDFDTRSTGASYKKAEFARNLYDKDTRKHLESRGRNLQKLMVA